MNQNTYYMYSYVSNKNYNVFIQQNQTRNLWNITSNDLTKLYREEKNTVGFNFFFFMYFMRTILNYNIMKDYENVLLLLLLYWFGWKKIDHFVHGVYIYLRKNYIIIW